MSKSDYMFDDAEADKELQRIQAIEELFDPTTRALLSSTGLTTGWRCLEVGAGGGSIARWLDEQVGSDGHVVAFDINCRFLAQQSQSNIEVIEADLLDTNLKERSFDIVHARYVLIHNTNAELLFSKMVRLLKPGGWLILEEPDFSDVRPIEGDEQLSVSFKNTARAIHAIFENNNLEYAFGSRLNELFEEHRFEDLSVDSEIHESRGATPLARMMKQSAAQLSEKYIATGHVTELDVHRFQQFAADPMSLAIYYATVRGIGRKPGRD